MKKFLKIAFIIIASFMCAILLVYLIFSIATVNYKLDKNKLVNPENQIFIYDSNDKQVQTLALGKEVVDNSLIPSHVKNAFVAIEDKRFYSHEGIDFKGLIRASFNNVKSLSFKEGASTITQQLIKNTHLYSEKTLIRKFAEMKLAVKLERELNKDEILCCYLNTIYFGEGCYGISSASRYYFNKNVEDLTLSEGACLAGMINAPSTYSLSLHNEKANERKNIVLKKMYEQKFIDASAYEKEIKTNLSSFSGELSGKFDYFDLVRSELDLIQEQLPYSLNNCSVYTFYNQEIQDNLSSAMSQDNSECEKSAIGFSKENNVLAYYSTCLDGYRQVGSVLKPLAVYAPALEENVYNSCSIIVDEKTDFNGYCPSNFNNHYYGKISFKNSLAKSLNVCSAKILNSIGIDKSLKYLNKTDIKLTENDKNLSIALGATYNGATLKEITSAYSTFLNDGYYIKPTCIRKIISPFGRKIHVNNSVKNKVFSDDTVYLINDALNETAISGTAKKLGTLNKYLCSKTGTVGNVNGNTDAYSISYNPDFLLGIRYSSNNNKIMSNSITGGANPTTSAYNFWNEYFINNIDKRFKKPDSVVEEKIDAISYSKEGIVVLADKNAPERFVKKELFRKSNIPKSTSSEFSAPKIKNIETFVNSKSITIRLCLTEYINAKIYRVDNNKKIFVFNTFNNKCEFIDYNVQKGQSYEYVIVPYYKFNDEEFYGEELKLNKIKVPTSSVDTDIWWENGYIFE